MIFSAIPQSTQNGGEAGANQLPLSDRKWLSVKMILRSFIRLASRPKFTEKMNADLQMNGKNTISQNFNASAVALDMGE